MRKVLSISECALFLSLVPALLLTPRLALARNQTYTTCVTNKQIRHYGTVRSPRLSPNGREVVWVQFDSTADGAASHLWMAPVNGSEPARQITFSHFTGKSSGTTKQSQSQPQWMPGGSAILFIAKHGKVSRIFKLPMRGGEAAPIKLKAGTQELDPKRFSISPDGHWIVFSAKQPETKQEKENKKKKKDAVIVGQNKNPTRAWLYSFKDDSVVALTPVTREANGFAWNPDSREIAISTEVAKNSGELPPNRKLEIVSVSDPGHPRAVRGVAPTARSFAFSPSGQQIAYIAQSKHDTPPGVSDVYVIPAEGGTARDISSDSPGAVGGFFANPPIWAKDGKGVYVEVQHRTRKALLEFPVSAEAPQWQPAAAPVATSFSTNHNHTGWTFIRQATNRMPQIVYANAPNASGMILSDVNAGWPAKGWRTATTVSWQGSGGLTIEGLYYAPASCPGSTNVVDGKTPMILMAHGGPTGAFTQNFSLFTQWLTSQGWAVLQVNPRGSTGYGWQFAAANRNDLGGNDYLDEMAGVRWALAHKPVDPHRLGMFGYSYGGEMAAYIEGKTHRFAAIVAGAPVIDQFSEYGTERGHYYDRWFFGRPWMHPDAAMRQSPLSYAKNAKTPLLLLQGQADTTDPIGQSEEEYRALFEDGVPVKLMTFPRDNHVPLAEAILGMPSNEPWHGYEAREQILAWFKDHFRQQQVR